MAAVAWSHASCCLRVIGGPDLGLVHALGEPLVVGRDVAVDVRIDDVAVSRRHFELIPAAGGEFELTDLGSRAGTYVGGDVVRGRARVRPGDTIHAGGTTLRVLRLAGRGVDSGPRLVITRGLRAGLVVGVERPVIVGRDGASCDVVLPDPAVSRQHCVIAPHGGGLQVENRSQQGTNLNGAVIAGRASLADGDMLVLGTVEVRIDIAGGCEAQRTVPVEIDIEIEGVAGTRSVVIEAAADATVADVAAAIARTAGAPRQGFLYRAADGLCPDPATRWDRVPVERADVWMLARGPAPVMEGSPAVQPAPYLRQLTRPPRVAVAPTAGALTVPPLPREQTGVGIGWQIAAGLVAVVASLALAVIRPEFAVFAYVMAGAAITGLTVNLLSQRARRRAELRTFDARLEEFEGELVAELARQRSARHVAAPPATEVANWAIGGGRRLWERRAGDLDVLDLRVGTADQPASIAVESEPRRWDNPDARQKVAAVVGRHTVLDSAPFVVSGVQPLVVGVVGEPTAVAAAGRALLVQVVGLHAPDDVAVFVLATSRQWWWARWLPHAQLDGQPMVAWDDPSLEHVCATLTAATTRSAGHRVFVLIAAEVAGRPAVRHAAHAAQAAGATIVVLTSGVAAPVEPDVVVDLAGDPRVTEPGRASTTLRTVETIDQATADRAGRALARYRGSETGAAVGRLAACELWDVEPDAFDALERWRRRSRLGPIAVGRDDTGRPVPFDIRGGSPHGVIAGTTGSGKSELLKTIVLGLCLEHPPDRVALFLMDFKGGSTFVELGDVPHVVGMVTDLASDEGLVERAFLALDAEIRRRKAVLDAHRLSDIIAYEALGAAVDPMPALVVLIDEFALLNELYPELVPRLDTIAMQGRSLGIHLLLATQDPGQVITRAIRANTGLWMCLRVANAEQSRELLGSDAAAQIPLHSPGRGYVRVGAESAITAFQTARVTVPHGEGGARVKVRLLDDPDPASVHADPLPGEVTVLDAIATRLAREVGGGHWRPQALWLPPLPTSTSLQEIESRFDELGSDLAVAVGRLDAPEVPAVEDLVVDFIDAGHVLAVGRFGSGRTTFARTVAVALAERYAAHDVHVYAIDGGDGSLTELESIPHVGAVIGIQDTDRVTRLLVRIWRELQRRRVAMSADGATSFRDWRSRPGSNAPWIVILLDEIGVTREVLDKHADQTAAEILPRLLAGGPAVGIHGVLTASHSADLRSQITNLCGVRFAFDLADPGEAGFAIPGLRRRKGGLPAGRADMSGEPTRVVQIARAGPLHDHTFPSGEGHPVPVRSMPSEVGMDDLALPAQGVHVIGVGGAEIEPVAVDFATDGQHLLVLGESGTGRTTALQTIVAASGRAEPDRRVWVIANSSGWPATATAVARSEEEAIELLTALAAAPGSHLLVIDDAERLPRSVTDIVGEQARAAARDRVRVVVAGRAHDVVRSYDDTLRYLVSLRHALLLSPAPDVESAFDLRPGRHRPAPHPGRGALVSRRGVTPIQVAISGPSANLWGEHPHFSQPT